jgi:hypothetical protein
VDIAWVDPLFWANCHWRWPTTVPGHFTASKSRTIAAIEQKVSSFWTGFVPSLDGRLLIIHLRRCTTKGAATMNKSNQSPCYLQDLTTIDICALQDHSTIEAFYLDNMRTGNPIPPAQFRRYRLMAGKSTADYEVLSTESIELPLIQLQSSQWA